MPNPATVLLHHSVGQAQERLLYGEVSLAQPVPQSFADPLYVVRPEFSNDWYWKITDWPACNGTALPIAGTPVLVVVDSRENPRVVWWESASTPYPPGHEWEYAQITSTAAITDTAEATATAIIPVPAFTPDGNPVMVEFGSPLVTVTTSGVGQPTTTVTLFEGATEIGRLATLELSGGQGVPVQRSYRFTPTAASHTYKLCAYVNSTTGAPAITAGAGGTSAYVPAYVRFTKV